MSVFVKVSVAKSADAAVHADAAVTGRKVIALLADISKQAEALGYNMKVKLRQTAAPTVKAATISPAVKAEPSASDGWPVGDLSDPSWRP